MNVYNSLFDKCSALESGGAMFKGTAEKCNFTSNKAKWGGAKHSSGNPTINCRFINNYASDYAGALYGNSITNCTFINNSANNTGGAVYGATDILNCNFTNCYANESGGAVKGAETITSCNFTNCYVISDKGGAVVFDSYGGVINNSMFTNCFSNTSGGAVYKSSNGGAFYNSNFTNCSSASGGAIYTTTRPSVSNCTFTNNRATNGEGGAVKGSKALNCSFINNTANRGGALSASEVRNSTFYNNTADEGNNWYDTSAPTLNLNIDDFTSMYGVEGKILLNASESDNSVDNVIITIRVYKNDTLINTYDCMSNTNWTVDLNAGVYTAKMSVEHHAYNLNKAIKLTITQRPTNITVSNISTVYGKEDYLLISLKDFEGINLTAKTISVSLNGIKTYTTDSNGQIKVPTNEIPAGDYIAVITFNGTDDNYNSTTANANVTITKAKTLIAASPVTTIYNNGDYLIATLSDENGNLVKGVEVKTNINWLTPLITDANGQVKWLVSSLVPNNYNVVLSYDGGVNYISSTETVSVNVAKITPKFSAKAKTFKRSVKNKKYAITLKVTKKVKVTLKVNKKTYSAYTNTKGKATFKITKLTKKGKYTATLNFKGDAYYNKASAKVKITVK